MKLNYSHAYPQELLVALVIPPTVFMHREVERGLQILRIELDKDEVVKVLKADNARLREAIKNLVAARDADRQQRSGMQTSGKSPLSRAWEAAEIIAREG